MISLSSTPAMLAAMRTAKDITFSSYFLPQDSGVERELIDAARRGARVTVRLNGYFYNGRKDMLDGNKQAVRDLTKLGANAKVVHLSDTDGPMLHLKASVCDGVAFLDDRNWAGRDMVLRDDSHADVRAVRSAASYAAAHCKALALTKREAIEREVAMLRGDRIDVETETITCKSPVYARLKHLVASGARCRLLVSSRKISAETRHAAQLLRNAGVHVRTVATSDKLAVSAALKRAWVGSANATSPYYDPEQTDWGYSTTTPAFVRTLEHRFATNWRAGSELAKLKGRA